MDNRTRVIGLVLTKTERHSDLKTDDFYEYGTLVHIHHPHREDGKVQFIAQGTQRFRIKKWISKEIPFVAQVEYFDESIADKSEEVRAYSMAVVNALKELIPFNPLFSEELKHFLTRFNSNDTSPFADFSASMTTGSIEEIQDVISTVQLVPRLLKVLAIVQKDIQIAKLHNSIREEVDDQLSDQQRQYFLREQLKVIQQELGLAKDDKAADIDKFVERLLDKDIPIAAQERIDDELEKLQILETGSTEYGVTRN